MVVLPAASRPTIKILISFLPQRRSNSFEKVRPMLAVLCGGVLSDVLRRKKGTRSRVLFSAGDFVSTRALEFQRPLSGMCFSYAERGEYACLEACRICVPFHAR